MCDLKSISDLKSTCLDSYLNAQALIYNNSYSYLVRLKKYLVFKDAWPLFYDDACQNL